MKSDNMDVEVVSKRIPIKLVAVITTIKITIRIITSVHLLEKSLH